MSAEELLCKVFGKMKGQYPGTAEYYVNLLQEKQHLAKQVQGLQRAYAELVALQAALPQRTSSASPTSAEVQAVVLKARGIIQAVNSLPLGSSMLRVQVEDIRDRCREIADNPYLRLKGDLAY